MRKRRSFIHYSLTVVVLSVLVVGSFAFLNERGFFSLQKIVIQVDVASGTAEFLADEVSKLQSSLDLQKGKSLWSLGLGEIADKVENTSWVQQAQVSKSWPNQVIVKIKAHDVKLLYLTQRGGRAVLRPVNQDGEFLPEVSEKIAPDVAVLHGSDFESNLKLRKRAVALLNELPSSGGLSPEAIADLHYDSKEGFWATLTQSHMKVKLGEEQIALKARRVSQVIDYLGKHDIKAKLIDANLSKKVLVQRAIE